MLENEGIQIIRVGRPEGCIKFGMAGKVIFFRHHASLIKPLAKYKSLRGNRPTPLMRIITKLTGFFVVATIGLASCSNPPEHSQLINSTRPFLSIESDSGRKDVAIRGCIFRSSDFYLPQYDNFSYEIEGTNEDFSFYDDMTAIIAVLSADSVAKK